MAYSALSLNEVIQRTGLSKEEISKLITAGKFPVAIPLGPWTTGWSERDIEEWLSKRAK
ncbi:MAG: AlpA family phage regulatory protein [Pseudomonadota bacterium]